MIQLLLSLIAVSRLISIRLVRIALKFPVRDIDASGQTALKREYLCEHIGTGQAASGAKNCLRGLVEIPRNRMPRTIKNSSMRLRFCRTFGIRIFTMPDGAIRLDEDTKIARLLGVEMFAKFSSRCDCVLLHRRFVAVVCSV